MFVSSRTLLSVLPSDPTSFSDKTFRLASGILPEFNILNALLVVKGTLGLGVVDVVVDSDFLLIKGSLFLDLDLLDEPPVRFSNLLGPLTFLTFLLLKDVLSLIKSLFLREEEVVVDAVVVVVEVVVADEVVISGSSKLWFLTFMMANFSFIPGSTKNFGVKSCI